MRYSSPSILTHRHEMFKLARLVTKAVNVSAHHPNPCQPSSLDIFISTENFPIPALPIRSPSRQKSMGLQNKLQNSSLKVRILSVPAKPKLTWKRWVWSWHYECHSQSIRPSSPSSPSSWITVTRWHDCPLTSAAASGCRFANNNLPKIYFL
jgi:hypothetical protein